MNAMEGYEVLDGFTIDNLKAIYERAGVYASRNDEKCPPTFKAGVRIDGLVRELVDGIVSLSKQRTVPEKIAAYGMHFPIWRQPFKNCNHRTGFVLCEQILGLFNLRIAAEKEEAVAFTFSINAKQLSLAEVERWIKEHLAEA